MILSATTRLAAADEPQQPAPVYRLDTSGTVPLTADGVQKDGYTWARLYRDGQPATAAWHLAYQSVTPDGTATDVWEVVGAVGTQAAYAMPQQPMYDTVTRLVVTAYESYEDGQYAGLLAAATLPVVADPAVPLARSDEWAAGNTYRNGEIIIHQGKVYQWTGRCPGNSTLDPQADTAQNPASTRWRAYELWPLLATSVLFAPFALLGGFVVSGDTFMSQTGTDAQGQETQDYRQFASGGFTPYLLLNAATGYLECLKARVRGTIEADAGYFAGELRAAGGTFSGDLQAARGTFAGLVRRTPLAVNASNINEYAPPYTVGQVIVGRRFDFAKTGGYVRFNLNAMAGGNVYLYMPGIFQGSPVAADSRDDVLALAGVEVIVEVAQRATPGAPLLGISGAVRTSPDETTNKSLVVPEGGGLWRLTCTVRRDSRGYTEAFWLAEDLGGGGGT